MYNIIHYNQDGEKLYSAPIKRVDIITSHSLFYHSEQKSAVYRIYTTLTSVNLERGIITAYYLDGSYIIITKINA